MTTELPEADTASPWMKHLETAHARAFAAGRAIEEEAEPSPHLGPAARELERGLVAMYDAFDGRAERATAMSLAHGRLWAAAILVARGGLTTALGALQEACAELVSAEERFPRVPLAGRTPRPLRAGGEGLPLHSVERASLAPSFRAPPEPAPQVEVPVLDLPEPTTFEELAAVAERARRFGEEQRRRLAERAAPRPAPELAPPEELPPGFAAPPAPALGEDDFVRGWARECCDEIGMIGVQRTPLLGDTWRSTETLERRLVAAIDALAALGPVAIAHVEPLAKDAPAVDPMRVFAVTLVGGCLEGRDALAAAERVLFRFGPGDPVAAEAFVSAMRLAPNPFAPTALRSLLGSGDPAGRVVAAEVLAHRGWLTPAELEELAEAEDPRLLAIALPALAIARHRDLGRAIGRALASADARLHAAALDAMALAAHPEAASRARAAAAGPLGEAALTRLAIVGDEADARWLLDVMRASPTAAAIEAVGWAGHVDAVPVLLSALESGDDEAKLAAGAALERLLGGELKETIEVEPESLDEPVVTDPDPEPRPPQRSLPELVSDPRDLPPRGAKDELEVASTDPARWRAHWAGCQRTLDRKQRVRRGQAYSPSVSLHELDRLPLPPTDRRRLHRELAARTGKLTPFDPHDLVVVQVESLKAWEAIVRTPVAPAGAWSRPVL